MWFSFSPGDFALDFPDFNLYLAILIHLPKNIKGFEKNLPDFFAADMSGCRKRARINRLTLAVKRKYALKARRAALPRIRLNAKYPAPAQTNHSRRRLPSAYARSNIKKPAAANTHHARSAAKSAFLPGLRAAFQPLTISNASDAAAPQAKSLSIFSSTAPVSSNICISGKAS